MSEAPTRILTEAERNLRKAAERLARLQTDPSFVFLLTHIDGKRERMKETMTAKLLGGGDVALLQRQVDYDRGFIDGAVYLKTVVDTAARQLQEWDEQGVTKETEETDGWAAFGEDRSA